MSKKTSRTYSNSTLSALSHPLRVSIYELIQKGAKTTIELEKILNENRVNLYHHLNVLEKVGLIESYFEQDRLKKFRLNEDKKKKKTRLEVNVSDEHLRTKLTESSSVVLIPNEKNQKKFHGKVKELLEMSGISIDKSVHIQQVQIVYQNNKVSEAKVTHLRSMQGKK